MNTKNVIDSVKVVNYEIAWTLGINESKIFKLLDNFIIF